MARNRILIPATLLLLVAAGVRMVGLSQLPPGLHYDEAANGILASNIAYESAFPVFIGAYTGKEVLWFYLAALMERVAGAHALTLRLTSVFFGLLSVAIAGWTVQQLYADDDRRDVLALLTMAILAVSFWHGILSRLAFRAITEPMMQGLSLGLLWRAFRAKRRQWQWFAAAGISTGLVAYTYLAARLFPIPLMAVLATFLVVNPHPSLGAASVYPSRRERLRGIILYGVAALSTFAPLGLFFLREPEAFTVRTHQLAPTSLGEALGGWRLALEMFFLRGDVLWRFNIPGKPIFGPILGGAFVFGALSALVEAVRARSVPDRARGLLLIIWLPTMLVPVALSTEGIGPSHLRAVGLLPLLPLYPALGLVTVLQRTLGRWRQAVYALTIAAILLAGGAQTLYLTSTTWGANPSLYVENMVYLTNLATYLNQPDLPSEQVYVATYHYRHPVLAFLVEDYGSTRSLFGGNALVLEPEGETVVVYARDTSPPEEWLEGLGEGLLAAPPGPDGIPDFAAYAIDEWPIAVTPATGNFGNVIALEGVAFYPARASEEMSVDLAWRVLAPPDQPDLSIVMSINDAWDWRWAQRGTTDMFINNNSYPSEQWWPGERLLTRLRFDLPDGLPPGEYTVQIGLYSQMTETRLPVLDSSGAYAGISVTLSPLHIEAGSAPIDQAELQIQHRTDISPVPGLRLLGYDRTVERARPGENLLLALYWLAEGRLDCDTAITLSLNNGAVLYEGSPVHGSFPTTQWEVGQLVLDRYDPYLPTDLAPGTYHVLLSVEGSPEIDLGPLSVEATERHFEPPPDMVPLEPSTTFGEQVTLLGYQASAGQLAPGESLSLTLVWRAEQEITTGYTVFVHLVDTEGTIITQQDSPPLSGAYPTDLWLPGEVIVDPYTLALPADTPPGEYTLRIGLYIQETGQRLAVPGHTDNAVLLPISILVR